MLWLGACIQPQAYPCERDEQCDAGEAGVCHPEAGFCAYADGACNSGLRFESNAPRPFAGACVGDVQVTGTDSDSVSDTAETTTGDLACGGSAQECCEPADSCDPGLECLDRGCGCVSLLVSGNVHSCYVRLDGLVQCWGGNERGELGRSDPQDSFAEPGPVQDLPSMTVVSAQARQHTCMVSSAGDVYCWGDNSFDQADPTGPGLVVDPPRLVASAGDGRGWTPQLVGVGPRHTCISGEGRISCWGNNESGQLGFSGDGPQDVDTSSLVGQPQSVAAGFAHTCVWTDDVGESHVYCWGADDTGQLGAGAGDQSGTAAVEVDLGGVEVFALVASDIHTCVIVGPAESGSDPSEQREVRCWGGNEQGQAIGPNAAGTLDSPTEVVGLGTGPWTLIAASSDHTCVTSDDSETFCWGDNAAGRVEPIGVADPKNAIEVPLFDNVTARPLNAQTGEFHTCALTDDGAITCWGCGGRGQLGPNLAACDPGSGFASLTPTCTP